MAWEGCTVKIESDIAWEGCKEKGMWCGRERRERDMEWEGCRGRGIWRGRDADGEEYGMGGM